MITSNNYDNSNQFFKSFQQTPIQTCKSVLKTSMSKNFYQNNSISQNIKVDIEGSMHEINIVNENTTCGWVLRQVQGLFQKLNTDESRRVVALKTDKENETIDYYLTMLDR